MRGSQESGYSLSLKVLPHRLLTNDKVKNKFQIKPQLPKTEGSKEDHCTPVINSINNNGTNK